MVYQVAHGTSLQDKFILLLLKIHRKTLPCMPSVRHATAGNITGYKAKVPITLCRIQSRSQGYVP